MASLVSALSKFSPLVKRRKAVIDESAYPHIIDSILEYLVLDHPAALALQTTSRAWRRKIRSAVFAHIRAAVPKMEGVRSRPNDPLLITTTYQFSTVPSLGGKAVCLPVQVFRDGYGASSIQHDLPVSLMAVSPFIQALDLDGKLPFHVEWQLSELYMKVRLLRLHGVFPNEGHVTVEVHGEYEYIVTLNKPQHLFHASPLPRLLSEESKSRSPQVTIHLDPSSDWKSISLCRFLNGGSILSWPTNAYFVFCSSSAPPSLIETLEPLLPTEGFPCTATLVGLETFLPSWDINSPDPWNDFLHLATLHFGDNFQRFAAIVDPPSFMSHDEYLAKFGQGTCKFTPPSSTEVTATAPRTVRAGPRVPMLLALFPLCILLFLYLSSHSQLFVI